MVAGWARRNVYGVLVAGAMALAVVYAWAGYARGRAARAATAGTTDGLLGRAVHLDFDGVRFYTALRAVVKEAGGTLERRIGGNGRISDTQDAALPEELREPRITVHRAGTVALEEAIATLVALRGRDIDLWYTRGFGLTACEEAGVVFIVGREELRERAPRVGVFDVADLAGGGTEAERVRRRTRLEQMVEAGASSKVWDEDGRKEIVVGVEAFVFGDKLIVRGDGYWLERAGAMLRGLRGAE